MGAEEQLLAEVEGIPALASGVPLGDVEGLEVVPLGFDLRAQLDLVAQRLEHGLDLPADLSQDMDMAALERRAGKRRVRSTTRSTIDARGSLRETRLHQKRQLTPARADHFAVSCTPLTDW